MKCCFRVWQIRLSAENLHKATVDCAGLDLNLTRRSHRGEDHLHGLHDEKEAGHQQLDKHLQENQMMKLSKGRNSKSK